MTSAGTAADAPRIDVRTTEGAAQVRVLRATTGTAGGGTVLLGHGAGGLRDAADVVAMTDLVDDGWTVVLVDQPWRVAGRRVASRPPALDRAFSDLTRQLGDPTWQARHGLPLPRPWVLGGRSAGARVACRAAVDDRGVAREGVAGVVCLAFPLHPPGAPERSRADELAGPVAAGLPTLVVQGDRDPFGSPEEVRQAVPGQALVLRAVRGNHSPARDLGAVLEHVRRFLAALDRGDPPDTVGRTTDPTRGARQP